MFSGHKMNPVERNFVENILRIFPLRILRIPLGADVAIPITLLEPTEVRNVCRCLRIGPSNCVEESVSSQSSRQSLPKFAHTLVHGEDYLYRPL